MISALRPSADCAFTSDLCRRSSSVVLFLPMIPSTLTFFSVCSPFGPRGGGGALTEYISAFQPSESVWLTIAFLSRRWATTSASLWCAAHISGVLPSLFCWSTSARILISSWTHSKCPRSAATERGVLPFEDDISSRSARLVSSILTTSRCPLRQPQVSALKPSVFIAAMSAFCSSSQVSVTGLHWAAAICRGVAPASSEASRFALCFTRCCIVTMSSM
mmetsp:Transcript_25298/g.72944  ORF Transcript_25298/g.72944 Transcript_25298/m.72944 type:complete len:219 (-) Transcript_25298:174-830(-)